MADVYDYIISTGVVTPDAGEILTEVQDEYKNTFGSDLVVTPNTPQGMLITAESLARIATANNNAVLANQINPNEAGGVFLDAIGALTNTQRTPEIPSTVTCNLTGVPGTFIAQGVQARESVNGAIFQSQASVTLSAGGTATVDFEAIEAGPIPAAAGTLTQIVSDVLGWETITNPDDASLGQEPQSDIAFREFRRNTLGLQGSSLAVAIISALYATDGVLSLSFRENVAATTEVIDGITMVSHSIYACVDGGTDLDVATALTAKKSGGCAYNNGASGDPVTQPVTQSISGQTINVLFDRPDIIEILARATIRSTGAVQDPESLVKQAILDYANGQLDGEPGLVVGASVSPFELAGAVNREQPTIYVQKMEISLASPVAYQTTEIPIELWEKARISEGSISVIIL